MAAYRKEELMYRAKVKKKLLGLLSLPSIGHRAYKPGDLVYITPEQYWLPDVQAAFNKGILILEAGNPKTIKMQTVTNIGLTSLILPVYGVVRSGDSKDIKVEDLSHPDIDRLIISGKLTKSKVKFSPAPTRIEIEVENEDEDEITKESRKSPVDQKMQAHVHKPKSDLSDAFVENDIKPEAQSSKKKAGKKKGVRSKHITDNEQLIDIENGVVPGEKDGIQFVDIEQTEERIQQHPTLRKLKGK
jgi:hypothetical protein